MRILVACEMSGRVRDAFAARGHDAISCDLLPSMTPGKHVQGDVRALLREPWDMVIAFPPCTDLCVSGARWFKDKKDAQEEAAAFFMECVRANAPMVAIENPIGIMSTRYRKPDQIVQPWQFGHGETKATCLWLKGLPLLTPTEIVDGRRARVHLMPETKDRAVKRSLTYEGIAQAMADQWGKEL